MAREMKDSGVAWIGKILADWQTDKFSRVASIKCNLVPPQDYLCYPQISPENMEKGSGRLLPCKTVEESGVISGNHLFYEGQILYSKIRPKLNKVCIAPFSGLCSADIYPIESNQNTRFIMYCMLSDSFVGQVAMVTEDRVKMPKINQNELGNLLLALPPNRAEQQAIAEYLDRKCAEIDTVLGQIHKSIDEYQKLKQAVITQAVTKGIRKNRPMKDSGIEWVKKIPTDWDVIPSRYLFRNSDERKHFGDELLTASQKYGIISQKQYMERENTGIVLATKGIENWKHVEPYDFIISLRSFQGGLEMSEVSGCITWHYIVLKPLKPIHSCYFKWLFKSELYVKALQRTCNFIRDGQDLRYSNFVQVPLFIPPLEEQEEIADVLNRRCTEIDTLIQKKEQFISEMESYKKSLIYEYVTGKKEVPQA